MQNNVYEANIEALIKAAEILEERQTTQEIVCGEESPNSESSRNEIHKSIFNRDARKTHNQLEKSRRANIKWRFNRLKELVPNTRGKKCSSLSILRGAVRTVQMLSQRQSELELLEKQLIVEGEDIIKKREMKRQELVALEIDPDEVIASAASDKNSKSNNSCDSKKSQSLSNESLLDFSATECCVRGVKRLASHRDVDNHHQKDPLFEENESTTTASECGDDCDVDELTDDASECGETMHHSYHCDTPDQHIPSAAKLMSHITDDIVVSLGSSGHSLSSISDATNSLNNSICSGSSQSLDFSQRILPVKKRRLDWANFSNSQTDSYEPNCASIINAIPNQGVAEVNLLVPALVKELPITGNNAIRLPSSISSSSCSRLIIPSELSLPKSANPDRIRTHSELLYQTLTTNCMTHLLPISSAGKTQISTLLGFSNQNTPTNRMPVLERTLTETELGKSLNLPNRSQIVASPPPPRRAGTPGPFLGRSTSLEAHPEGLSPFWIGQKMQPVYNLLGGNSSLHVNDLTPQYTPNLSKSLPSQNDSSMPSKSSSKFSLITSSLNSGYSVKSNSSSMHNQSSSLIRTVPRTFEHQDLSRISTGNRTSNTSSLYSHKPVGSASTLHSSFSNPQSSIYLNKKQLPYSVLPRASVNTSETWTNSRLVPIDSSVVLLPVQLATTLTQNATVPNRYLDTLITAVQTQPNGRLSINDSS